MWPKRSLLRRQQSLTSSGDTTVRLACLEEGQREGGRKEEEREGGKGRKRGKEGRERERDR